MLFAPRWCIATPGNLLPWENSALSRTRASPPSHGALKLSVVTGARQARLADVNALVKIKNPSLLLQLQRAPPRITNQRRLV